MAIWSKYWKINSVKIRISKKIIRNRAKMRKFNYNLKINRFSSLDAFNNCQYKYFRMLLPFRASIWWTLIITGNTCTHLSNDFKIHGFLVILGILFVFRSHKAHSILTIDWWLYEHNLTDTNTVLTQTGRFNLICMRKELNYHSFMESIPSKMESRSSRWQTSPKSGFLVDYI